MMSHLTLILCLLVARSVCAQNSSSAPAQDLTNPTSTTLQFEDNLTTNLPSSATETTPTLSSSIFAPFSSFASSASFSLMSPSPTPTPSNIFTTTSDAPPPPMSSSSITSETVGVTPSTSFPSSSPSPSSPSPTTSATEASPDSTVIIGAVVGGVGAVVIIVVVVVVLVVCYCCCCQKKYTEKYQQYSITTRYWDNTTGQAAHYQAGGSLRSINRNASLRSSLGLRPKVGGQNGDYIANPTAELYSTPL